MSLYIFINPNTSLHSVVFLSTFRSDCAAFIRMTNGRLAETGTFKVFFKKLALKNTLNVPVSANLPFVILMKAAQSDRNVDRKTTEWRLVLGLIKMSSTQSGPKGPSHGSLKSFLWVYTFWTADLYLLRIFISQYAVQDTGLMEKFKFSTFQACERKSNYFLKNSSSRFKLSASLNHLLFSKHKT